MTKSPASSTATAAERCTPAVVVLTRNSPPSGLPEASYRRAKIPLASPVPLPLQTITESLKRADILKMNLQEAHYLAEVFEISLTTLPDFCSEMMEEWSLSCCLVTLGAAV